MFHLLREKEETGEVEEVKSRKFLVLSFSYRGLNEKEHIRYSTYVPKMFPDIPEDNYLLGVTYTGKDTQMCITGARQSGYRNLHFYTESVNHAITRELSEEVGIVPDKISIEGESGKFTVAIVNIKDCRILKNESSDQDFFRRDIPQKRIAVYVYGNLEDLSRCVQKIRNRLPSEDTYKIDGLCLIPVEKAKKSHEYCYAKYSEPTKIATSYSSKNV